MQKTSPFLWFDDKAEEAANFHVAIFQNSKIANVMRYGEAGPGRRDRSWASHSSSTDRNS
jgi:predicted 3-demethylubiquinone-9 3-methyltransferase (glyoxalase superfamily)